MILARRPALVVAALLLVALGLVACGPSKAQLAAQNREQCFAYEKQITMAMNLVHADSGIYPSVQDAAKELGAKCPSGGTYSFDPKTDTVSCSIHGHP